MRAIDADHLKRWILSRVFKTQLSVVDVIDQIDREDTIEPERKHGEWIHERLASTTGGSYPIVRCSNCGGAMPFEFETPYCYICGADMRGDEAEYEVD